PLFMSELACEFNDATEDDVMGLELGRLPTVFHTAVTFSIHLLKWKFCNGAEGLSSTRAGITTSVLLLLHSYALRLLLSRVVQRKLVKWFELVAGGD
ncbi:hypothetical protein C5167_033028, partial [Papaver somniferum]